jgi:hypothetical protein
VLLAFCVSRRLFAEEKLQVGFSSSGFSFREMLRKKFTKLQPYTNVGVEV